MGAEWRCERAARGARLGGTLVPDPAPRYIEASPRARNGAWAGRPRKSRPGGPLLPGLARGKALELARLGGKLRPRPLRGMALGKARLGRLVAARPCSRNGAGKSHPRASRRGVPLSPRPDSTKGAREPTQPNARGTMTQSTGEATRKST